MRLEIIHLVGDTSHRAISLNMHTPPMDDMVCLSQGVIQTSTALGGTVSYFVVSRGGGG